MRESAPDPSGQRRHVAVRALFGVARASRSEMPGVSRGSTVRAVVGEASQDRPRPLNAYTSRLRRVQIRNAEPCVASSGSSASNLVG